MSNQGGVLEDIARVLGQALQPPGDHVSYTRGHCRRGLRRLLRVVDEETANLGDEEGITTSSRVHLLRELDHDVVTNDLRELAAHNGHVESSERNAHGAALARHLGEQLLERRRDVIRHIPVASDDQQCAGLQSTRNVRQHLQRRGVRHVDIVEDENARTFQSAAQKEGSDFVGQPKPFGIALAGGSRWGLAVERSNLGKNAPQARVAHLPAPLAQQSASVAWAPRSACIHSQYGGAPAISGARAVNTRIPRPAASSLAAAASVVLPMPGSPEISANRPWRASVASSASRSSAISRSRPRMVGGVGPWITACSPGRRSYPYLAVCRSAAQCTPLSDYPIRRATCAPGQSGRVDDRHVASAAVGESSLRGEGPARAGRRARAWAGSPNTRLGDATLDRLTRQATALVGRIDDENCPGTARLIRPAHVLYERLANPAQRAHAVIDFARSRRHESSASSRRARSTDSRLGVRCYGGARA